MKFLSDIKEAFGTIHEAAQIATGSPVTVEVKGDVTVTMKSKDGKVIGKPMTFSLNESY